MYVHVCVFYKYLVIEHNGFILRLWILLIIPVEIKACQYTCTLKRSYMYAFVCRVTDLAASNLSS